MEITNHKIKYINLNDSGDTQLINEKIGTVYIQPINIENNKIVITLFLTSIKFTDNKYSFEDGDFKYTSFAFSYAENKWLILPQDK